MGGSKRYPHAVALSVANELVATLAPYCERIVIAGSLRRQKPDVGDIEILYVPKIGVGVKPGEMLESEINWADAEIKRLETPGCLNYLQRRLSADGKQSWGPKNKLAVHWQSGIPVDLFVTSLSNWWVSLVIRTGSTETNLRLTTGARQRGRSLLAYGCGVKDLATGEVLSAASEQDIFYLCGVPYLEPTDR